MIQDLYVGVTGGCVCYSAACHTFIQKSKKSGKKSQGRYISMLIGVNLDRDS